MHRVTRRGFTLIETMLAVTVGLMLIAGSIATYNQINKSSKFARSKTIVGTVQTNIQMDKFRLGSPPPLLSTTNDTTGQLWGVGRNRDSQGKPYWPDSNAATAMPMEPVSNVVTVTAMPTPVPSAGGQTMFTPAPLGTNAPTPEWDQPYFGSPAFGQGGWLYDVNTGAFRANLSNRTYPEQRPGNW